MLDAIFRLHQQGKTVVIVTHNNEIARRAGRVIRVKDGRIEEEILSPSTA